MKKYTILTALLLATLSFGFAQSASAGVPLLIKTADRPEVYFVSQALGAKKVVVNEAAFNSYGNQWSWVKTVSQNTMDRYPDIRLVKTATNPDVYFITGTSKQLIPSETVFNSWGFSWSKIFVVNQTDLDSYRNGQPLITREQYTAPVVVARNKSVSNRQYTRSVADKTGQLVVSGKNYRDLDGGRISAYTTFTALEFKVSPRSRQTTAINRFAFDIYGAGSYAGAVNRAYITDEYNNRLTPDATIVGNQLVFDLTGNPLMIYQTKTLRLRLMTNAGDFYIGAILRDASSISTVGTVTGRFPIQGQLYDVDNNRSHSRVNAFIMPLTEDGYYTATIGSRNQILAKVRLAEIANDTEVQLNQIAFFQTGTVGDREVTNYELVDEYGNSLASARYTRSSGNKIIFVLRRPLVIPARGNATLYVRADIRSGEGNLSSLTIATSDDIQMTVPDDKITIGAPVNLVNPGVTFDYGQVVTSNVILEQVNTRRLKSADADEINLGSFNLKTDDFATMFDGVQLMIISRGDNRPLKKILIKHEDKTIGAIKFSLVDDQSALVELSKTIKIGGTDKYSFDVIGIIDEDAERDSNVQLVITGLDITNADGSAEGGSWFALGERLPVFQD